MKKILITGANSYIGTSFEDYIKNFDGYEVTTLDMIGDAWKNADFSGFDVVFHVAGIAHIKETEENKHLYYDVNRDLAIETALKAKDNNVKQFVLLSSMSVFGMTTGVINKNTIPAPVSNYGKSKLEADTAIEKLCNEDFKVAIMRPPMVYGENCKGNYQLLKKFALKFPFFPDYKNERSMIHISTLCEKVKEIIDGEKQGYFYPQDTEYVCTTEMVKKIAEENGKKVRFVKIFNPVIRCCKIGVVEKVFGNLIYEKNMEDN